MEVSCSFFTLTGLHLLMNNWFIHQRASWRYEARGKFGEHKRCVRVARGVAESNSSFLSALQTSQVLHISMKHSWHMNQLFYNIFNAVVVKRENSSVELQRIVYFVSEKNFATLQRSCLRLVKKLTGEFMHVNEDCPEFECKMLTCREICFLKAFVCWHYQRAQ